MANSFCSLHHHIIDERDFGWRAARAVARKISQAIDKRGHCVVGFSFDVSADMYHELCKNKEINWSKVYLFLTDELIVPPDDPGSNQALAREILTDAIRMPAENLVFPDLSLHTDNDAVVADYAKRLDTLFAQKGSADLVVLCLGIDGHVASLFPPLDAVHLRHTESAKFAVPPELAWKNRVTCTIKTLCEAGHKMILFKGRRKLQVWNELMTPGKALAAAPVLMLLVGTPEAASAVSVFSCGKGQKRHKKAHLCRLRRWKCARDC